MDEDVKVEDDAMNKTLLSKITISTTYLSEKMLKPTAELALTKCENDITALGSGEAKYDREISKYEYKIDEEDWQEGEWLGDEIEIIGSYKEFLNQEEGKHTIKVRVTDNLGVVSDEVEQEIILEKYIEPINANLLGKEIPLVKQNDGLYKVRHCGISETTDDEGFGKEEYRYAGNNPNNYVLFNNEKWRIIGLVNVKTESGVEKRVKIIRTDGIENQKDFGEYVWNYNNKTDWTTSTLKEMLNGIYYNSEIGECYNIFDSDASQCDFSTGESLPKGLDDTARKMIDKDVIWSLGGISYKLSPNLLYEQERGTTTFEIIHMNGLKMIMDLMG